MNSKPHTITFAFRRPRFPLICDLDGDLFAVASAAALQRRLGGVDLPANEKIQFVDASGEGWVMLPDEMILAPEFRLKNWRKIEIISLFNGSRVAKERGLHYPEHNLGNCRLEAIVRDIAALLTRKTQTGKTVQ